jgi:hypothetical protein
MQCVTKAVGFQAALILAAMPEWHPSMTFAPSVDRAATAWTGMSSSSKACCSFSKMPSAPLSVTDMSFQNRNFGRPKWRYRRYNISMPSISMEVLSSSARASFTLALAAGIQVARTLAAKHNNMSAAAMWLR